MPAELSAFSPTLWITTAILAALMVRGAWRGYRRGPLRQLAGPTALTIGQLCGWLFGGELGHALLQGSSYPWMLRGITGVVGLACLAGLLSYALLWRLGRTPEGQDEAESPVLGALVGCWTGALYFLLLVGIIASVASVYDLLARPGVPASHWTVAVRDEFAATPLTRDLKEWSPIPEEQRTLVRQTRRLMADPEAIVATGMGDGRPEWLSDWEAWPRLTAVRRGNLFHINPDLMQRHTARLLDGTEQLCALLDAARGRRPVK
jgi:hypothetical protein